MDKPKMAEWREGYKAREIAKLDEQGRHRSQWIYSYYDGRQDKEIPHGAGYEIKNKNNTE
jgi:hypothetical protein